MLGSLATFGYASKEMDVAQEITCALVVNPDACVIDTRLHPWCGFSSYWRRSMLERSFAERYIWKGNVLGNLHHREPEKGIKLADEEQGIAWLLHFLEQGKTAILLCACAGPSRCHRTLVANKVRERLGTQLQEYQPGQRVLTPYGPGRIDPFVPIEVQRARNRYAVLLDMPNPLHRYFFAAQFSPFDLVQPQLIA
ncbi:hypothetical protein EPA93_19155 [Ktedonosporobacter rubrisoli]|uniref:DUF488 domain-containing protein n=1 Tax=Ktedonosporobacter rubrisoli TaxID=2509675 RepID=A0A4P6JRC1_KTERU|nr:hypothetical protein [Ktedonosporobacter rubrisoli]QBD77998.1 hypothetical protein EPA93_19155 [Ktedonosporobacter rubrisoli]